MIRLFIVLLFLSACGPERMSNLPDASADFLEPQDAGTAAPDAGESLDAGLTGFPCDVRETLQAHCARCHARQQAGRPHFSTRDNFFGRARSGALLGQEMVSRLAPGAARPMPPNGASPVPTAEHRQVLNSWVDAGMPGGECGPLTAQ